MSTSPVVLLGAVLLVVLLCRQCSSTTPADYRYFTIESYLFATNGTSYWPVRVKPGLTDTPLSDSIHFEMFGPYPLINVNSSVLNFTKSPLKLAFAAQMGCSILVLVDQRLDYEIWRIEVFNALDEIGQLAVMQPSEHSCNLIVPEAGNMRFLPTLDALFNANQTLTSVVSNLTELYFLGKDIYVKVMLETMSDKDLATFGRLTDSLPDNQTLALFSRDNVPSVLVTDAMGTRVCSIKAMPLTQMSKACQPIIYTHNDTLMSQVFGIKLGDGYDDDLTTKKKNHVLVIMLVSVVVGIILLIVVYILATKFLCSDSVATIPVSGLTSKFVGKIKSCSSIKTLKS